MPFQPYTAYKIMSFQNDVFQILILKMEFACDTGGGPGLFTQYEI